MALVNYGALVMVKAAILIIALVTFLPVSLAALSPEQRRVLDSGAYFFNVGEPCVPARAGPAPNASEIEATVFWFFVGRGYSKAQAAAILGNMWVESGVEPRKVQYGTTNSRGEVSRAGQPSSLDDMPARGGYGLIQWTPGTKILADAQARGLPPGDLQFQLELIYDQLAGRSHIPEKRAGEHFRRQTTVRDATYSFMDQYLRPGKPKFEKRLRFAERVFDNFAGQQPPPGIVMPATAGANICPPAHGQETIIDGFVVYSQHDPAWRNRPYGTSTISRSGCGPSAIAMIVSTFGRRVTPDQVAAEFGHHHIPGIGSSWALMIEAPRHYGLTSINIYTDFQLAVEALRNGALVIATGTGPKPFTTGGHIIVLRGVTAEGKILVGDSGHADTSNKEWEPAQLSSYIRNMWVVRR